MPRKPSGDGGERRAKGSEDKGRTRGGVGGGDSIIPSLLNEKWSRVCDPGSCDTPVPLFLLASGTLSYPPPRSHR